MSQFYFSGRSRENRMHVVHDTGPSRADILAEVQQRRRRRELEQRHRNAAVAIQRAVRQWRARQDTLIRAMGVLECFARQVQSASSSSARSTAEAAPPEDGSLQAALQQAAWCYGYVRRFAHLLPRSIARREGCVRSDPIVDVRRGCHSAADAAWTCAPGESHVSSSPCLTTSLCTNEDQTNSNSNSSTNNNINTIDAMNNKNKNVNDNRVHHAKDKAAGRIRKAASMVVVVELTQTLTHAVRDLMTRVSTAAHGLLATLPRRGWLFMGQLLLQWFILQPPEQRGCDDGAVGMLMTLTHTLQQCAAESAASSRRAPCADASHSASARLHWETVADELACMTLHFCHMHLAKDTAARQQLVHYIHRLLGQGRLHTWDILHKSNHVNSNNHQVGSGGMGGDDEEDNHNNHHHHQDKNAVKQRAAVELSGGVYAMTHVYAPPWSVVCWDMMCAPSVDTHLALCGDAVTTLLSVPAPSQARGGHREDITGLTSSSPLVDIVSGSRDSCGPPDNCSTSSIHHQPHTRGGSNSSNHNRSRHECAIEAHQDNMADEYNSPYTPDCDDGVRSAYESASVCAGLVAAVVRVCYTQLSAAPNSQLPNTQSSPLGGSASRSGGHALARRVLVSFSVLEKLVRLLPFFIHALRRDQRSVGAEVAAATRPRTAGQRSRVCTSSSSSSSSSSYSMRHRTMRLLKQWLWCVAHLSRRLSHTSVFAESILYDLQHTRPAAEVRCAHDAHVPHTPNNAGAGAVGDGSDCYAYLVSHLFRDDGGGLELLMLLSTPCAEETTRGRRLRCGRAATLTHDEPDDADDEKAQRSSSSSSSSSNGHHDSRAGAGSARASQVFHAPANMAHDREALMCRSDLYNDAGANENEEASCHAQHVHRDGHVSTSTTTTHAHDTPHHKAHTHKDGVEKRNQDEDEDEEDVSASSVLEMACRVYAWPLLSFALSASSAYRRETAALFAKLLRHPQLLRRLWRLYRDRSFTLRQVLPVNDTLRQLFARAARGEEEAVRLPPPPAMTRTTTATTINAEDEPNRLGRRPRVITHTPTPSARLRGPLREPHPALAVLFFTLFGYYADVTDLAEDLRQERVLSQAELWALVLTLKEVVHVAHMEGIAAPPLAPAGGEAVAHAAQSLLCKLYAIHASCTTLVPYPALWISLTAIATNPMGLLPRLTSGGGGVRAEPAAAAAELWSEVTRVRAEERRRGRGRLAESGGLWEEQHALARGMRDSDDDDACEDEEDSDDDDDDDDDSDDDDDDDTENENEEDRDSEPTMADDANIESTAHTCHSSRMTVEAGGATALVCTRRRVLERRLGDKFPFLLARRRRTGGNPGARWRSRELRAVLLPHGCRRSTTDSSCEADGYEWGGDGVTAKECRLWDGSTTWSSVSRMARILLHAPFLVAFSARASLLTTLMLTYESETMMYVPSETNLYDVVVHRETVFEDAFGAFASHPDTPAMRNVRFGDRGGRTEEGYGFGVYREFVVSVCEAGFAPEYGLFAQTPQCHVYPNAFSLEATGDASHLHKISFLGAMVGRALRSGILQSTPFALHFCNTLLGRRNSVNELKRFDAQLYQHLHALTRLSDEEMDCLGLTFTYTVNFLGVTREVELIQGGAAVAVSRSNCLHYIHLVADYKLNVEGAIQARAFRHGLKRTISTAALQLFGSDELMKLFHGDQSGEVDVEDWQAHTVYSREEDKDSVTVRLFWQVVRSLSTEQQRRLLQFATSFNRPPLLGFRFLAPPFHIVVEMSVQSDHLPSASTCFSLLKLPPYDNLEVARAKIVAAIEGANTFECS